jgi:hypothetical protein
VSISCAKSATVIVRRSSAHRKVVRQRLVVAALEIAQALGELDVILHTQDRDTLDALGDQT